MIDLPGGGKAITQEEYRQRREAEARAEREEVARHVLWHNGDRRGQEPGSFTAKLLEAWARADGTNDMRLRSAFPLLGEAVEISRTRGSDALAEWAGIA
jgi:hypothetical protein